MAIDWTHELTEQLDWREQTRPGFAGLSDSEYFWEPVENCWSVRPREQGIGSHRRA